MATVVSHNPADGMIFRKVAVRFGEKAAGKVLTKALNLADVINAAIGDEGAQSIDHPISLHSILTAQPSSRLSSDGQVVQFVPVVAPDEVVPPTREGKVPQDL